MDLPHSVNFGDFMHREPTKGVPVVGLTMFRLGLDFIPELKWRWKRVNELKVLELEESVNVTREKISRVITN